MALAETNCALGIRRMYRLYAKPIPSVPITLPTDTTTSSACGWMSLTFCKDTSRGDLSSLGGGLEGVEKNPMAKQRINLEPRPRTYGELDEGIFSGLFITYWYDVSRMVSKRSRLGFRSCLQPLVYLDRQSSSQTTAMSS